MIYLGSRYSESPVVYVLDSRTNRTRATVFRDYPGAATYYRMHKWREGDRLDLLASQYYDGPGDWWRILDANPEIVDPASLVPGQSVRIP